ncbi:MAG: MBOAT family O-acyltransferase [Planctomycetota bacterium]
MHFTSITFLLFLPLVLVTYRCLGSTRHQNILLLITSYIFYGWWDFRFCVLMLISSLLDFYVGRALSWTDDQRRRRQWLTVSLVGNLGLLATFKYLNFCIESFQELGRMIGFDMSTGTLDIILPVGISFYTFQTMSYTIDVYRGDLQASDSLVDFLAFVSFFPQLVAGPIERAIDLLPQLQRPRMMTMEDSAAGVRRILCGFFKKIVIADSVAPFVSAGYADPSAASGPQLVVATVMFAFQIYCDFSAYSDIAIGTARLFGIRLTQNFNYPYFSRSLQEFWQAWHISLSTWFRDYVYIPLGGNRGTRLQRDRNILLTFIISGIWHGAAWRFLGWGALHGTALVTENKVRGSVRSGREFEGWIPQPLQVVKMLSTFVIVCLGWVMFRADTMKDALLIWKKLALSFTEPDQWSLLASQYSAHGPLFYTVNLLLAFIVVEWILRHHSFPLEIGHWPMMARWPAYTLVLWLIVEHADRTEQSPFIYFQF